MPNAESLATAAATAPISTRQAQLAKLELQRMRSALQGWLKYRAINDAAASGTPLPTVWLKRPGASAPPPAVIALRLRRERQAYERELASDLHALLSEVFDSSTIPSPDLDRNPNAAVDLARIAISGKVPGDTGPQAAGFIWLWPLVIVIGGIAFVLASKIRNDAETAQEREHYQCIRDGHCTDSGFWLKVGAVGFLGWLTWDRLGVGERLKGLIKKKR
jgi:hypothetical protein